MADINIDYLERRVKKIETIIYGDVDLNIPSVNDRLKGIDGGIEHMNNEMGKMKSDIGGINSALAEMVKGKNRERWIGYAITFFLALTSVGMMAVIVLLIQLLRQ